MVVWGLWMDGTFLFSTGKQSRKARNLGTNSSCVICNEDTHEATIVEGIAKKLLDVSRIRGFLKLYEKKYKFDLSGMGKDILSLKEPLFMVSPTVVFGLHEKKSLNSATRWRFT
jgi:hypothetical protein